MNHRKEIENIFKTLFIGLDIGDFEYVKKHLQYAIDNVNDGKILVSYLSATNPWKNEIIINETRNILVSKTEKVLILEIGETRKENVIKGLR